MADELNIKIGADSSGVRSQADSAKSSIKDLSASARADAAAMAAGFDKLNATLLSMRGTLRDTADATSSLKSYADMSFVISLLTAAFAGLKEAASLSVSGVELSVSTMLALDRAVSEAPAAFLRWSETMAYASTVGLNLRATNTSLAGETIGAIGRMSISFQEWIASLRGISIEEDNLARSTMAANGSLRQLAATAPGAGFANAGDAIASFNQQLQRIPGVTEQIATGLNNSISRIPAYSAQMNQALVLLISNLATTKESAADWTNQLVAAMSNPLANGQQLLDNLGGINREFYAQLSVAKASGDASKAQAIILNAISDRMREQVSFERQKLDELAKGGEWFHSIRDIDRNIVGSAQVHSAEVKETEESVRKLSETEGAISEQLATQAQSYAQIRTEIQGILAGTQTESDQLGKLNSDMGKLRQGIQGATGDASAMIQKFESVSAGGFTKPYMDKSPGDPSKDHYAVGYGQHSILGKEVTQDSVFSQEDIYQDFRNRIAAIQDDLAAKLGESWDKLSARAKASLTSVAYNYGSLPANVMAAARTGVDTNVATSILSLKGQNNGVNDSRRNQEAANITAPDGVMSPAEKDKAAEVLPKMADETLRLNEAKKGGNAVDLANVAIQEGQLTGKKNEVADQEKLVTAAQESLRAAKEAGASDATIRERTKTLTTEQLALDEKRFALKMAEADVKIRNDKDDPAALRDDKVAKANLTESRYAKDTVQFKQAEQDKSDAQDAFRTAGQQKDAEAENVSYTNALRGLDQRKQVLQEEEQTGQITKQQMYAGEVQVENDRTALEKAHFTKLMGIWDETDKQYKQAQDKLAEIDAQSALKREQIQRQANASIHDDYLKVTTSITGTMSSSIMGMIQGTSNFRDMMRSITLDIIKMFLDAGLKMVANWAAQQLQMVVLATTGQTEITAATITGLAARTAAGVSGAAASLGAQVAEKTASVTVSAGQAGAGVAAFLAPFLGPAAIPAGAAAAAETVGIGAMDIGAYDIPHDQLAMVHKNELVMTASQGNQFREMMNMVGNGGSGRQSSGGGGSSSSVSNIMVSGAFAGAGGKIARDIARSQTQNASAYKRYR